MKKRVFWMLLMVFFVGFVGAEEVIRLGDSTSKVFDILGKPRMKMVKGGLVYCVYDGGRIALKDGKVVEVPDGFSSTLQKKQAEYLEKEAFLAEQKVKGLVLYKSKWVTLEQKARLDAADRVNAESHLRAQASENKGRYEVNRRYAKEAEVQRRQDAKDAESKRRFDVQAKLKRDRQANADEVILYDIDVNSRKDIYYH